MIKSKVGALKAAYAKLSLSPRDGASATQMLKRAQTCKAHPGEVESLQSWHSPLPEFINGI